MRHLLQHHRAPITDNRPPPADNRPPAALPQRFRGRDSRPTERRPDDDRLAMSDTQRKLLFRLAYDMVSKDRAAAFLLERLGRTMCRCATPTATLVVVAIIGLLATLAVVALGNARAKSRDAKRVSDVSSIIKALAAMDQDQIALAGCTAAGAAPVDVSFCSPNTYVNFLALKDPTTPGSACSAAPGGTCQYSIRNGAVTGPPAPNDFKIFFYLESGASGLSSGAHTGTPTGMQ